jgi:hypothetical protein
MNTEQIKEINTHLALIEAEMGRIRVMVREAMEQPESNNSNPNHYIPKVGEVVEVGQCGNDWQERIYTGPGDKEFPFACVDGDDSYNEMYRNGKKYQIITWQYCRRLNGEIIEFGCDKKGVAESAESRPPAPILNQSEPDYSHWLPQGYEFCAEEVAEKWIKVKNPTEANPLGHIWQLNLRPFLSIIGEYRPIRKIQTASYQVDWTNAPDWADVHCWDKDGKGYWHGTEMRKAEWCNFRSLLSSFTLPDGLDWKLSKTFRPQ